MLERARLAEAVSALAPGQVSVQVQCHGAVRMRVRARRRRIWLSPRNGVAGRGAVGEPRDDRASRIQCSCGECVDANVRALVGALASVRDTRAEGFGGGCAVGAVRSE